MHQAAGCGLRACSKMADVSESFVDITYRGLPVGRRVKLSQIRPTTGYLELAQPMPVGTAIDLATDDGVTAQAIVTEIHEQVGGSEHVPGMRVRPALDGGAARAWWDARVTEQEPPPPSPAKPRGKRPTGVPELVDDGQNTAAIAVPEVPAELAAEGAPAHADAPIVDDGKRTIAMTAIDIEALGLTTGDSGNAIPAATGDDASGEVSKPNGAGPSGTVQRRKRKRR